MPTTNRVAYSDGDGDMPILSPSSKRSPWPMVVGSHYSTREAGAGEGGGGEEEHDHGHDEVERVGGGRGGCGLCA